SNIRVALVAALDHWSTIAPAGHRNWVLSVTRLADPDPTGWRDRARDPNLRADQAALTEVIRTAPGDQSVPLLLALDKQLTFGSRERVPFLKRVQQAHPDDFWANLTLAGALTQGNQAEEAIRYNQAAVSIRPRLALGYYNLGQTLLATGRTEEA